MQTFKRKRNRLERGMYRGHRAYSVTICTAERREHFRNPETVRECCDALQMLASAFRVYLYTFMPDHLHLLLVAHAADANLIRTIQRYKQRTAFAFTQQYHSMLWQKGYYDHILREHEDIRGVARYIADNPVRAGIVRDYRDYPYTGSLVGDVPSLVA